MAKPLKYRPELADKILGLIMDGNSMIGACRACGVKHSTFLGWVVDDRDKLSDKYSRAMKINAMIRADECAEIADDGRNDWMEREGRDGSKFYQINGEAVRRSEIRVKWRQWYFEKAMAGGLSPRARDEGDGGGENDASFGAVVDLLAKLAAQKKASAGAE